MANQLKFLLASATVTLALLGVQIHSSEAMDAMAVSLIQPDGAKRAMKLNLDQPLSELRSSLMGKGVAILADDKFQTSLGDISPREEAQWTVREAIKDNVLSFKFRGSFDQVISAPVVEQVIKSQETEKREKQEKVAFWGSGIDKTLSHIKGLGKDDLPTWKLLFLLGELQTYYTPAGQIGFCCKTSPISLLPVGVEHTLSQTPEYQYFKLQMDTLTTHARIIREDLHCNKPPSVSYNILAFGWQEQHDFTKGSVENGSKRPWLLGLREKLFDIAKMKMDMYRMLQNAPHPLWEEFRKMK
jgi:hypothetical protein